MSTHVANRYMALLLFLAFVSPKNASATQTLPHLPFKHTGQSNDHAKQNNAQNPRRGAAKKILLLLGSTMFVAVVVYLKHHQTTQTNQLNNPTNPKELFSKGQGENKQPTNSKQSTIQKGKTITKDRPTVRSKIACFKANQSCCNGCYKEALAEGYRESFNATMQEKNIQVTFTKDTTKLAKEDRISGFLTGGTCSVKTIVVIRMFFTFLDQNGDLHLNESQITEGGPAYANLLKNYFDGALQGTDETTRALQAALNTLIINETFQVKKEAAHREKIRALLAVKFKDVGIEEDNETAPLLSVGKYTDTPLTLDNEYTPQYVDLAGDNPPLHKVQEIIETLQFGVYFVRLIKEEENYKQ